MLKVFRLYKEGTETYSDWANSYSFPYNATARDSIEDPEGASASNEITSIPSPFARIDLIKAAFKEVSKSNKKTGKVSFDGDTIFHKMVSDTLDVAEIFFNIDKYKESVEVIKWDVDSDLKQLKNSTARGHRYLADSLTKYMRSDSLVYHFDKLKNVYLLNYRKGPKELNIIGATSPATLFFSNANDLSFVNDIFFGEDRPFDGHYQPLYKRDFEFVKYLFALQKSIPDFTRNFPEVYTYLEETFKKIEDQKKKDELREITAGFLDQLSPISVASEQQSDEVEVLGYHLYKRASKKSLLDSDFVIKTSKTHSHLPFVLPTEAGNHYGELRYTSDKWGNTNAAPYYDELELDKRLLPFDGTDHPYLTISDFLEDNIIEVPHMLNKDNYFNGNLTSTDKSTAYLLPIKTSFFEYFSPIELRTAKMKDGKPMFEMETLAGGLGVKVYLRIPIKGTRKVSYVEYSRLYYKDCDTDIQNNKGGVCKLDFTGFIMPLVKFKSESDAIYNVSCIQNEELSNSFDFYKDTKKLSVKPPCCRTEHKGYMFKSDNYLIEGENFDFIQVKDSYQGRGIILPIFNEQRETEKFEFAIDLGTSNTHIEFCQSGGKSSAFAFSNSDRHVCEIFTPTRNDEGKISDLVLETELIGKDFLPSEIGSKDFHFPTRTVLSCAKTIDWQNDLFPFGLINLSFTYDKRVELTYNNYECNIKWGNANDASKMEAYIRCLMLIVRNKVLLNGGDLQNTKITWFYPISMSPKRLGKVKEIWNETYQKYFGSGTTNCISESSAPIQYFFKKYATATSMVNVDIGGGTTDVAFANNERIDYVTSFRFGANTLFEDSFSQINDNNGIIDYFKDAFAQLLEKDDLGEIKKVFKSKNNVHPANMASFLFGLKDNSIVQKAGLSQKSVDFNFILREDEDFKIAFIIFYTAIIYHIAQIVKSLGLETPRHISFSGNGSKVIQVISSDMGLLERYSKIVFEKVLNQPYGKKLELLGLEKDSSSKVSTCKGGIICKEWDDRSIREIVFKSDCSGIVEPKDTYAKVDADYKKRTIDAVNHFFDFVFTDMNKAFNLDNNFGVTSASLNLAQKTAKEDIATFLDKGITQRREESEADCKIEETFFFYPIKGVVNAISDAIFKELKTNKTQSDESI